MYLCFISSIGHEELLVDLVGQVSHVYVWNWKKMTLIITEENRRYLMSDIKKKVVFPKGSLILC